MANDLDARLKDWEARLEGLERTAAPMGVDGGHLLFVPSPAGYDLVECTGDSPATGELLELEGQGARYSVTRVVRSPLPGDERPCAYLEATSS